MRFLLCSKTQLAVIQFSFGYACMGNTRYNNSFFLDPSRKLKLIGIPDLNYNTIHELNKLCGTYLFVCIFIFRREKEMEESSYELCKF